MSTHDPRADAYAAALTGLVDAHVAARVLCGPPSWRAAAVDVGMTIVCCATARATALLSTPYLASLVGAMGVAWIFGAVRSVCAYRLARRRYLDAVREVADAYARLHELEPEARGG